MSDYDNTNSGALFKNDKDGNEKSPDYKGSINVNGVEFWLSSWLKVSKKGQKYMSLSVQPKEAVHNQGVQQAEQAMGYSNQQANSQGQAAPQQRQQAPPQQQAPQQQPQQQQQPAGNCEDFDNDVPF